jgi:aminoglycoside phosphotransferase (APT) family kinase protein
MHDGEAEIDVGLVQCLVTARFPDLAALPVSEVRSTGTVNAIYRLGEHFYASAGAIDVPAALAVWESALQAPVWDW